MDAQAPWAQPRLRAAWARHDIPAVFREYRSAAGGISQTALGGLVGLSQADVSLIERGKRDVKSAEVLRRITEGLCVPSELLEAASMTNQDTWSPDPELAARIARAHITGRTETKAADWMIRVLAEHRRAEDDGEAALLWPTIRAQLNTVTKLIPGASGPAADRLLLLSAEHAHWLSWVAHGQGHYGAAVSWLDMARGWALDAGSADMASWLTRVRAYYQLDAGDPARALRTAEAAIEASGRLSPSASSIARHTAAMAAAAVGERDRARRLADQAYEAALQAPDEGERPGWLYWLSPTRAKLLLGEVAHAARDWETAATVLGEGLGELDGFPRDAEFYRAKMTDARRRA